MTIIAILVTFFGLLMADERGKLTANIVNQLVSVLALVVATVLLCYQFGTLRGVFVFLGVASVLGTLLTLFRAKLINNSVHSS
ncbi:hypothetical protein [Thalassotalea euphylliae]|uniref:Uncharacterized protein n=1 Tax=Thalassotalea euphylliae TaxID=1655234 RepID=A0A3E0UED2_9GAMM|nr:hypothetical protein [Thalassotalea euphylliae]REL35256.1 hypothetical protein DXX92_07740 [Thalassotalea euphylliae]